MYSFRLQLILRVQDTVFEHDEDYPFLDPACLVTPCILTDCQVKEMHETDLELGEWMEDEALWQMAMQPAPDTMSVEEDVESNDWGALSTMKELTKVISEPLRDVTHWQGLRPKQLLLLVQSQIKELDLEQTWYRMMKKLSKAQRTLGSTT
eukprot:3020569-Rhodomonas_salina.1